MKELIKTWRKAGFTLRMWDTFKRDWRGQSVMRKRIDYPMGSISSGTMRPEDLIPGFCYQLSSLARQSGIVPAKTRKAHSKLVREIEARIEANNEEYPYFEDGDSDSDLSDLFDALGEYAAPYFYFGAHPGDGAEYGFFLSESWDEDFNETLEELDNSDSVKVTDLSQVPAKWRGEVAVVNDHGNVSLYVKTSRGLREIWSVV